MIMVEFIMVNKLQLMSIIASAMAIGGIIVKLTPTKVDDKWFQKIKTLLGLGS